MNLRKLMVSAFMLLLSAVTLISTTFAWFAQNVTVSATMTEVSLGNVTSLYIVSPEAGTDVTNHKYWVMNFSDSASSETKLAPLKFDTDTKKLTNKLDQEGTYNSLKKDYISTKYTFWSNVPNSKLYFDASDLSASGITGSERERAFTAADIAYLNRYLDTSQLKLAVESAKSAYENALAMGDDYTAEFVFKPSYNAAELAYSRAEKVASGIKEILDDGKYKSSAANALRVVFSGTAGDKIWEPNALSGYNAPVYKELDVQDIFSKALLGNTGASPVFYKNPYATISGENELLTEFSPSGTTVGPDGSTYYKAELTVKIWLEGRDPDCFNVIIGGFLSVNLEFFV